MAIPKEHFDMAREALQRSLDAPGEFSDDEIRKLHSIVDGYEKQPKTPANFGEGGTMLGDTGMDMLEKKIQSPDDQVIKLAQDPNVMKAMKLSPKMETTGEFDEYNKTHDPSATYSASKRNDLIRPAEFIPEQPPATVYGGMNPLDMFSAGLDKARSNLPAFLPGGKVEHYNEPPLGQFRREMGPVLAARGIDVNTLGIDSEEYKEYSDMLWLPIYDQAKAEGRPVVRVAYKPAKTVGEKAARAVDEGISYLSSAAYGADETAFGGRFRRGVAAVMNPEAGPPQMGGLYPEPTEDTPAYKANMLNSQRMMEGHPGARLIGNFVGAGSSIGMGGLASRAIGGQGLARGAIRGAAEGMGIETSKAFSEDRMPSAGELFMGGLMGAPFGAIGGLHGKNLRQTTPLAAIEEGGMGETEMLRGVRKSARASEIEDLASKKLGPGRESDYLARELEGPMVKGARDLAAMTKKEIGQPQRQYFDMTKEVYRPQTPLLKEAMKIHAGGSYATGGGLPAHSAQNARLREIIADASHAEIVPAPSGKVTVKSANPNSFDLSPEEATQMGIDVDKLMKSHVAENEIRMLSGGVPNPTTPGELAPMWGPTGGPKGAPGEFVVRVTPRELNPEQTENIIRKLHAQIGEGKDVEALSSLHRASREVRDQFPAMGPIDPNASSTIDLGAGEKLELKGWSAWQHEAAKKTQRAVRVNETAGFRGDVPETPNANTAETLFQKNRAYGNPGRNPDADEALRELAGISGTEKGLKELAGQKGLDVARGGVPLSRKGLLDAARYRLDPLLTFYGPAFGALSPSISPTLSQQQKFDKMDPLTYQQLQQHFGKR